MNLGQVLTRLDTLVGGNAKRVAYYTNSEAVDAVNDWVENTVKRCNPTVTTETINVVAGTSAYTPATARVKRILFVKYDSSGTEFETALKPITYKEAMERTGGDPSDSSLRDTPEAYYVTYNSSGAIVLNLWPTPDTSVPRRGSITTVADGGGDLRFTSTSHGLAIGDSVVVSGSSVAAYDGTYTITAVTTNTFDAAGTYTATATATWVLNDSTGVKVWLVQGPAALTTSDTSTDIPVPIFFHQALPFFLAGRYYLKREDGKMSGFAKAMLDESERMMREAMKELHQAQDIRQAVVGVWAGGEFV